MRRISAQPFCSGESEQLMLSPSEVALVPVVARVFVREVTRTNKLAKRRRAHSVNHAGLEEHRAWHVLATRGFVVKTSLLPQYSPSPPMPCMCTIMRAEAAWRRGARGRERAGMSGAT